MSNALICNPLVPVSATAVTGTAAGAVLNVLNDYFGMIWRGSGTAATVQIDLGADAAIDCAAMLGVAGAPSGSWTIQYATAAQGTGFASVGTGVNQYQQAVVGTVYAGANALANGRQAGLWVGTPSAPLTARYVRFVITAATSGAFQVARLVLGRQVVLARNFGFGAALGVRPFGGVDYSNRGALLRRRGPKLRAIGLNWSNTYRDELEGQVQPLLEVVGTDTPILLVTDPDAHDMRTRRMYFGHLEGDIGSIQRNAKCWEWPARVISLF